MFDMLEEAETLLDRGVDPALQIRLALAVLAAEDRDEWTGPALSERVTELAGLRERLDAEFLRLLGRWDRDRAWEADGSLSAPAWLVHRTPIAASEAKRLTKAARLVDGHEGLADALGDGAMTAPHVQALSRVVSKAREPLFADHEATLVEQATQLDIRDFTALTSRWAAMADDALSADTHEQTWERRHLHASVTMDGWVAGSFLLDPAAGATLTGVLDYLAPPDPEDAEDGPRSLSQRRADALADLAAHYANGLDPAGNPPNINVVVDVAALSGDPLDALLNRRHVDGIGHITQATLEQIGCSATVTRVVMAGRSVVLDMGRKVRLATAAQRRALAVRDQHCRFPSCLRMPQWCDAHHIDSWLLQGTTDLPNLILLCRRHHTLIHQTRWTITRKVDGTVTFTHPARAP